MTLHETTVFVKKAGLGSVLGIIGIIFIVILVRIGIMIKNYYFPPKVDPPTTKYGPLPALQFPPSDVKMTDFTYQLQTTSGTFPTGLPDRLSVFRIKPVEPNVVNLDKAIAKVKVLGFTEVDGSTVVDKKQLGDPFYEWDELKDFNRRIVFNINSFDFTMVSDYITSLYASNHQYLGNEDTAIKAVTKFLSKAGLMYDDIDLTKTNKKDEFKHYYTYPQLFAIQTLPEGSTLIPATSLSSADVIRVCLYQKDIKYDLITGEGMDFKPKVSVEYPILYPHPPFSTMDFKVVSGQSDAEVVEASYTHQSVDTSETDATYKLKTPKAAWDELSSNKAYIAAYYGADSNIFINDIYLAYYLGDKPQDYPQKYLMPVYVFEGRNGFFAYVSAITENQLEVK